MNKDEAEDLAVEILCDLINRHVTDIDKNFDDALEIVMARLIHGVQYEDEQDDDGFVQSECSGYTGECNPCPSQNKE